MSEAEAPHPPEPRYEIPSAWRAMQVMAEAMNLLETNPDLIGEDVKLALESEAPAAADLLDALIANHLQLNIAAQGAETYAKMVALRTVRAKALVDRSRVMITGLLLALKQHKGPWRAPGGTASLRTVADKITITDEAALPDEFKTTTSTVVTTTTIDKAKIVQWLKDHPKQHVAGAELNNGGHTASITGL